MAQLEPGLEPQEMQGSESGKPLEQQRSQELLPVPSPIVRMTGIERASIGDARQEVKLPLDSNMLLIIAEGHGSVTIGTDYSHASQGKCFLLSPHKTVKLRNGKPSPLSYYRISFTVMQDDDALFARDRELVFEPFSKLQNRLRELLREREADDRLDAFHRHLLFQTLLYELLRCLPADQSETEDARQAVERTIAYLHRSYCEDIEIGRLARETNLSRWQYGQLFRSLTGEAPNRYLSRLRIEQAKQLLAAAPSLRVNEIAGRVGFRDEYYFSRRFKLTTGMTPTQFAQGHRDIPRIFSIQYLGELLALGIRPVGTNQAMLLALPEASGDIPAIEEPLDVSRLSALRPDLILYPSFLPRKLAEQLSRIARAVEIDWNADIYTRLQVMGEMLGKRQEASDWIARYKDKANRARNMLKGIIREGETASAFIYHANGLYVYGGHHFGHTLYEGVGFEPPPGIQALLDGNRNAKWQSIPFEAIPDYAGDRVFFALADSGNDALKGRKVLEHPAWKNLPAVRGGRSYVVKEQWANYNPLTLDRHLDEMVKCLQR